MKIFSLLSSLLCSLTLVNAKPDKIYGVNLGSWDSWFNQPDVDQLASLGINTVRIPLGYWLVEPLVDRRTEFYPRGGLSHLRRGLSQLKRAGIEVILDHHALPGVQTPNQMFAGRCTSDVQFYTDKNYQRALTWTAVMTTLSHIDSEFSTVFAIEAVNEPIMDANQTPGYGEFQKNFVLTMRVVEAILGIEVFAPGVPALHFDNSDIPTAFGKVASDGDLQSKLPRQVLQAIGDAAPIIQEIVHNTVKDDSALQIQGSNASRKPLVTNFMDINWQNNNPANPADAAIGPIGFDNHLYYSFGGVADPNEQAYLTSICNLKRVENDAALRNSPLWFGEWGLPTQFKASDEFLVKWADAQKLAYTKGAGWIFWNFKIETGTKEAGDTARQWSYVEGVRRGYLTKNPAQLHDPHVCDPYIQK
ncbi:hypothetical protein V5O48_017760 [Marasmius crinis-equi]|uniref:Glycoside hydrolase family 5 domain-containing protein n=1 Tax=Marasmius crinis-equi TaxID=585013 RepID=A0ABR3EN59_9AGAR